jgi:phosphatidylinositol alpha-mannosyltransferase
MARVATEVYFVSRRIAIVCPYALSIFGGVQEQALAMSRELTARGNEVLLVSPDSSDIAEYETTAKVAHFGKLFSIPANGSRAPITLSISAAKRVQKLLSEFKPDIVHFHEPFAPLVGWGALRAHSAPAVGTFHRSGDGPAFTLTSPLLKWLSKDLDAVASVSAQAQKTINKAVGIESTVLFNGFETSRFLTTPRERTGEVTLMTIGRLEERKGTAIAITAVKSHNAKGLDQWKLVIIGDGPDRSKLEALSGHDENIVFVGAANDIDKRAWLRRSNALLCPAIKGESFGLVLLEGMASETSVVASDIDGYREAAGSFASLFEPSSPSALEHAISLTLSSETVESIASARKHAENWSMSRLIDRYETLYEEATVRFHSTR